MRPLRKVVPAGQQRIRFSHVDLQRGRVTPRFFVTHRYLESLGSQISHGGRATERTVCRDIQPRRPGHFRKHELVAIHVRRAVGNRCAVHEIYNGIGRFEHLDLEGRRIVRAVDPDQHRGRRCAANAIIRLHLEPVDSLIGCGRCAAQLPAGIHL